LRALVLMLAVLPAAAEEPAVDFAPASAIVAELHGVLIDIMKNADSLGYAGRYQKVEPIVQQRFDTPLIVKVILSRHWNGLNDGQKTEFIQLFRQLSVATYASRFDSYSDQEFAETGREQLNAGRVLIRTELTRPGETAVKLDYLMHQNEKGEWLIISVIANGVNDLSLKRAEYAAVIKERGFDGLLDDIRGKIHAMESGTES
jgi:phospholipid transport system substrate-binding protein